MEKQPIVVERVFNATVDKVWTALTDKNEMKKWYFNLKEFKPEVGFEFSFTGGPSPEKQYLHLCRIEEAEPNKKLKHSWRYEGYEGNSFVTWELLAEGDKTRLRLTHEGLETFPASNPDLDKKNFVAGWDSIVNGSLQKYLENGER